MRRATSKPYIGTVEDHATSQGRTRLHAKVMPKELCCFVNLPPPNWDAQGSGWDLRNTPILSFDIWADKVMQIHVGLVDTTNGWNAGYGEEVADTYFVQKNALKL